MSNLIKIGALAMVMTLFSVGCAGKCCSKGGACCADEKASEAKTCPPGCTKSCCAK